MKTTIEPIDKNPICSKCGKEADYHFKRKGFFYSYLTCLCKDCLINHIKRLNILTNRDKKMKAQQQENERR